MKRGELAARTFTHFEEKLGIGSLISIWHSFLIPYTERFSIDHPRFSVSIHSGATKNMLELLLDGIIDLCIVPSTSRHPYLVCQHLYEERFELVGSASLFPNGAEEISIEEIASLPYIHIPWESPFSEWYEDEVGAAAAPAVEVGDTTIYIRMLLDRKMAGFLPELSARPYIESGERVRIPLRTTLPMPVRSVYMIHHKKSASSEAVQTFKKVLSTQESR